MIRDYWEPFCRLAPETEPDGLGGVKCVWREGETFLGGVVDAAGQAVWAGEVRAVRTRATLTHERNVDLRTRQKVKRLSDGAIFTALGESVDAKTPPGAGINFAQTPVERLVTAP